MRSKVVLFTASIIALLSANINAEDLTSQKCSKVSSTVDCVASINNDLLDNTKCLPITGLKCASWRDVQNNKNQIDYPTHQATLDSSIKNSVQQVVNFAKWASYAYDAKEGDTVLKDLLIIENDKFETKMVIGYDPVSNSIISSYRGTQNIINWIEDADFIKTDYTTAPGCNDCQVHQGFNADYNSMRDTSFPYVQTLKAKYTSAQLVCTGHSLGGAIAVLCATDLTTNLNQKVHLYSYGQPRVGNQNFANFQNSILRGDNYRAVYRNDPVPTVPYEDVLNFYHAGTEVHFYECSHAAYIAYPFKKDDKPLTDLLAVDDHGGYFCLEDNSTTEGFLQQ